MRIFLAIVSFVSVGCFTPAFVTAAEADLLVADFENGYGKWKVEGEAFGPGPAEGTLEGQMEVTGYRGKHLVNSFSGGDATVGTLTSPMFKIERDYFTFLIGGGGYPQKTCMNLVVDDKIARTAEGPNTISGGSERLEPFVWDVKQFRGRMATLQIVDAATGGWGHISVDHIVQTDTKPKAPEYRPIAKQFVVEKKYLVIPIKNGAKPTELTLEIDGKPVRRYETELATNPDEIDWYAFFTIDAYNGKKARVAAAFAVESAFALVRQSNVIPGEEQIYSEELRPQFHFSQKVGWINDPNGMVYLDGEWHLFFQHNPVGWKWGNMTWGHAVSADLIHWKQLPDALFPGTMARGACFSGGAIIDRKNTGGWKDGDSDVMVTFLTDTGAGESIAISQDRGRTFKWFENNPVIRHAGRDPKVVWYAYDESDTPLDTEAKRLGGHWVLAVYDEHADYNQNIAFYTSTNLKQWKEQSHLPGYFECPEIFELPVDGDASDSRWVVYAADARYALGRFDGRKFTPDHESKHQVHYGPFYASQTFENAPNGRRIQIGWARLDMPRMPFNQAFSFPLELTLRKTSLGVRMFAEPIREIEKLHQKRHRVETTDLNEASPVQVMAAGELFDIRATFEIGTAKSVGLDIGGNRIVYDAHSRKLNGAPLQPVNGRVSMQVLVDRPLLEICGNSGAVFITSKRAPSNDANTIRAFADGEGGKLVLLEVHELKSIWQQQE